MHNEKINLKYVYYTSKQYSYLNIRVLEHLSFHFTLKINVSKRCDIYVKINELNLYICIVAKTSLRLAKYFVQVIKCEPYFTSVICLF